MSISLFWVAQPKQKKIIFFSVFKFCFDVEKKSWIKNVHKNNFEKKIVQQKKFTHKECGHFNKVRRKLIFIIFLNFSCNKAMDMMKLVSN